ncbi:MAG: Crp/Fnr family transcriptional regulator [Oceanicaulis sp.]
MQLTDSDRHRLGALRTHVRRFGPKEVVTAEEARLNRVYWIESGWAVRYRRLHNGDRQIVNFMLPGDFFDLQGLVQASSDHTVSAVSELTVIETAATDFIEAINDRPAIFNALVWGAVVEESILREHIIQIGRQPALSRIAFLILELYRRQRMVGVAEEGRLDFPVGHGTLADAVGLSRVHVSRSLRALRDRGCVAADDRHLRILDLEALEAIAEYDDRYLHIQPIPAREGRLFPAPGPGPLSNEQ